LQKVMSILFGHPSGNPNSHHAALAHFEAERLEAFCIPWMPTPGQLRYLREIPSLRGWVSRLERRCFPPLLNAPRIEGRASEWLRMLRRIVLPNTVDEKLSYEANDWLMRAMSRESVRQSVTAVHSYEDCSLRQFEVAKSEGKACIYDMPIGYYKTWDEKQKFLALKYADWLPPGGLTQYVRTEQKRKEMELADVVLAPSRFVMQTIGDLYPKKKLALAPYGVDLDFWRPPTQRASGGPLQFIFAGQISIRKGAPILLDAWRKAKIKDAQLKLVGPWNLAPNRRESLPAGVTIVGPCSRDALRTRYWEADIFVLPSFFEGLSLASLEAMACGLPVIVTEVMSGMNLVTADTGRCIASGDIDALVESFSWFDSNRDRLSSMKVSARKAVEAFTWERYRQCVRDAVTPYVN
jgi:glycosyltransferase involved in cell wall biosynthesis